MKKQARLRVLDRQIARVRRRIARLQRVSYWFSWLRFVIVSGGLLAAGLAFFFFKPWLIGVSLTVCGLVFGVALYGHRRNDEAIRRHQVWLQIKSAHRARAKLDWQNIPSTFHHRPSPGHPFEADLDLVGQRSIHRLLDTAVTLEGSQRLRSWLTDPTPDPQCTIQRQRMVRELKPMILFRDRLAMHAKIAAGAAKMWEASQLLQWLERHAAQPAPGRWLILLGALAALDIALLVANLVGALRPWWQISLVLYLGLLLLRSRETRTAWDEALELQDGLRQLRRVFRLLETYSYYGKPSLKALCEPFLDRAHHPSTYLARITRIVAAMGIRGNGLVWFAVNAILPWDLLCASRLERAKVTIAQHAPTWMDVWFELEALSSLANLAYLNPDYTFPDILPRRGQNMIADRGYPATVLQARGIGHPLIPDEERICNDLRIRELGQISIITGSNMAGKSVFLKTLGVAVSLANAGGPACAQHLELIPFRLFTSMRVSDSVTDGISYFYAEVKRLKALLSELEREDSLPLIFCIDEIFRGTNNRERLIGSRAYVRALVGKRGLGFIATHDLSLAGLAEEVPQVENYHFRDRVVDGRMVFDYMLRPGPSPTTNALTIMQLEGLPVLVSPGRAQESTP